MTTIDLENVTLKAGSHKSAKVGMCFMEAASYFAGEPFSDAPKCVSPVLRRMGIRLNDRFPEDERQQLTALIPRVLNTAGDGKDDTRSALAADWFVREALPSWLNLLGFPMLALELHALPPIVDLASSKATDDTVNLVKKTLRDLRTEKRREFVEKLTPLIEANAWAAGAAGDAWAAEAAWAAWAAGDAWAAGAAWAAWDAWDAWDAGAAWAAWAAWDAWDAIVEALDLSGSPVEFRQRVRKIAAERAAQLTEGFAANTRKAVFGLYEAMIDPVTV